MYDARMVAVRRLVYAAHEIAKDAHLRAKLVSSTGLSPEGVALALDEHLEQPPSAADFAKLEAAAGRASSVLVLLSANVFVGALRAIVLARVASPDVRVRPSSREGEFARALVQAAGDPAITLQGDRAEL